MGLYNKTICTETEGVLKRRWYDIFLIHRPVYRNQIESQIKSRSAKEQIANPPVILA
jgi:uncharacterized protein YqjF (DUF2071 family)